MRHLASDVAVVIPVRDGALFVGDALSALHNQTAGAPQVIVVDDGSVDDTAAVVRRHAPDAILITSGRRGPGAARNAGVAMARTELVAFCDADDRWPTDRLAGDLDAFDADPALDVLLGRSLHETADPSLTAHHRSDADDGSTVLASFGAATVRRSAFDAVGPIAEDVTSYEDYDWFLRARERGLRLVVHDRIAQLVRVRPDSTSRSAPPSTRALLSTLKRSIDRRRALGLGDRLPSLTELREDDA